MKKFAICCSLLLLATLFACSGDIEPGRTQGEIPVVRGVTLMTVAASSLPETESFVGTVESPDRGVLAARIDGRIDRILVREGDRVRRGALLLTIRDTVAGDRLAEAEAALQEAESQLAVAQARLTLAQKTEARYRKLFAVQAVTPQEMDRVSAELETARQQFAAARGARTRASAARDAARTSFSYTRVNAPFAGRVVRKEVQAGSTVMPGTPLLVLDRQGRWQVRVNLPETRYAKVAVGDAFTVEVPALGRTFPGRVSDILPAADPTSRSFQVKITLQEGEGISSGMYARATLPGARKEILLIPRSALVTRGQLTGVYTVEQGILHYRLVRTGRTLGDRVEILSGLRAGERIVATGTEQARNGARVEE